jgi:hypothetical protein
MVTSSFTARAVASQPPEERLAMAEHYLRAGCFRDGWALYEARREIADYPRRRGGVSRTSLAAEYCCGPSKALAT